MILRLILGDQLNSEHSWFSKTNPEVLYAMMEIKQETGYVTHHIQKVTGFFLAMRNFSQYMSDRGHRFIYLKINDKQNKQYLTDNLEWIILKYDINRFEYLEPDEYRLNRQLIDYCNNLSCPAESYSAEHFLTRREELTEFFNGKKSILMETFYRYMRIKHRILLENDVKPSGGDWNYDKLNRKKLPAGQNIFPPLLFNHDVTRILDEIRKANIKTIGKIDPVRFTWPASRDESLQLLDYFLTHLLPYFGSYQDAMTSRGWSLFHSRLSFSLNTKMLSPLEIITRAETHWKTNKINIDLSQVEGFIRQILGWREYMRGIYWKEMPDYEHLNYFNHKRNLTGFFWTGNTMMECMKQAINQSLDHAYAHHIQRLMITGNFALLAGIDPAEVDNWYLGIYIDAIQWVEITNTRGMSQFADGGIVGTKPYVSTARYIDKMSDYCNDCAYSKSKKTGKGACPFNSLYWNFFDNHRSLLEKNPRIGMMYRTWDKMQPQLKSEILKTAENYLNHIENL